MNPHARPEQPDDGLEIVTVDLDDTEAVRAWSDTVTTTFHQPRHSEEQLQQRREVWAGQRLYAAREGQATVATFRSFDTHLSVPGGLVEANGVTSVTVLPTHRRRRLLSRWMHGELRRAADAGVPVSILIASEAPIYGRFGFGTAATACTWTVDSRRARVLAPASGTVRIVSAAEYADQAPGVYERARGRQPGAIDRSPLWWETAAQLRPTPEPDRRRVHVLHRDAAGTVDGALAYTVEEKWEDGVPQTRLQVVDLVSATDGAYAGLWRYCLDVDLVAQVVADDRSPAEPVQWLLADPRTARPGPVGDFLWVRLHDVPAALTARRYPVPGRVVLDVEDPSADRTGGRVHGRWSLQVDDDGRATCEPTDEDADVRLSVDALGSLWLGGVPAAVLARAGRLECSDLLRARLTALFGWPDPAWCGTWF